MRGGERKVPGVEVRRRRFFKATKLIASFQNDDEGRRARRKASGPRRKQPGTLSYRSILRSEDLSYIFVALSIRATILVFSLARSSSWRYIMWPAS